MIREDGKLPDGLELFIGERINELCRIRRPESADIVKQGNG